MNELPIRTARDLRELEAVEDQADQAAAAEALASEERRVPHDEVLAEYGLAGLTR